MSLSEAMINIVAFEHLLFTDFTDPIIKVQLKIIPICTKR